MERRRHARITVNLNVTLLDDEALPKGCRVRDVSQDGMLLQFEQAAPEAPYEPGRAVRIRIPVRDGEQRRVLILPATVTRLEEKGLSIRFAKPETDLMRLIGPLQLDREKAAQAVTSAGERVQAAATSSVHAFASRRPRHREPAPSGGARLAERIAAARESITTSGHLQAQQPVPPRTDPPRRTSDRRLLHLGLAALAVAAVIVILDLAASSSLRQRLAALETDTRHQAEALADVQIRLQADRDPEAIARLSNRVERLAVSVAALETSSLTPASTTAATPPEPVSAVPEPTPETSGPASVEPEPTVTASLRLPDSEADSVQSVSDPSPTSTSSPSSSREGRWVINLASAHSREAADRFSKQAQAKGFEVTQATADVKGRPVWRVQLGGFDTREAALAYADANKHKLGVKDVWVFRR